MPPDPNVTRGRAAAPIVIVLLAFALFSDLLLLPGDRVPSQIHGDITRGHAPFRDWGFAQLAEGNLPLWNPNLLSGTPYLAFFQPAILYPLNVVYLILPLAKAISIDMFLHLSLYGLFMHAWARNRGIRAEGAFLAAVVAMFAGPYSVRILGGNVTLMASFAWVPLLFLAVDKIFDAGRNGRIATNWCLVGIGATTMQILAGYPQALLITACAVGLYCMLHLIRSAHRVRIAGQLAVVGFAPIFVGAIQLWPGLAIVAETVRSVEASYAFTSSFSFPPECFLTLLAPLFFGDVLHVEVWSRWAIWETSLFMSITGLLLASYGAFFGAKSATRFCLPIIAIFVLIALGPHTPFHGFLYQWVPGFDKFRGVAKFMLVASLFAAILAGAGLGHAAARPRVMAKLGYLTWALGAVLFATALWIRFASLEPLESNVWFDLLKRMRQLHGSLAFSEISEEHVRKTARMSVLSLSAAVATCLVLGGVFGWTKNAKRSALILALVCTVELFVFARVTRGTIELSEVSRPALEQFYKSNPGDHRVYDVLDIDISAGNHSVAARQPGVWGHDAMVLKRYADLMTFAGGGREHFERIRPKVFSYLVDPLGEAINLGVAEIANDGIDLDTKVLELLRCKYIVYAPEPLKYQNFLIWTRVANGFPRDRTRTNFRSLPVTPLQELREGERIVELPNPSPHYYLVDEYEVIPDRDQTFDTLALANFDPRRTVLLEDEPNPRPSSGAHAGRVDLVDQSSDHLTFHVTLQAPAILVITDSYSDGWRARALEGSAQSSYDVVPAYHALRAVPLSAGEHRFVLEYSPAAFRYGRLSTMLSGTVFVLLCIYRLIRLKRDALENKVSGESATAKS